MSSTARLRIGPWRRWQALRQAGPPGGVLLIALRQYCAERRSRALGAHFRSLQNQQALDAYGRMQPGLFTAINARQDWANWMVIPRSLHHRAPRRPLQVLDLASGNGASSAALAFHLPPGSRVIALEYAAQFVAQADQRRYPAQVSVLPLQASILDPFIGPDRRPLAQASIDWINCSGALAHHFSPEELQLIARECARVLAPGAWAIVDARSCRPQDPVYAAFSQAGLGYRGSERSCYFDRYPQLCFQKDAGTDPLAG